MFYSSVPGELRAFFRDKLGLPTTDVGDGWLIFDFDRADMGVHPLESMPGAPPPPPANTHNISFFCDDIDATVTKLKANGVQFTGDVQNFGYGLATNLIAPGELVIHLYQPLYKTDHAKPSAKPAAKKSPAKKAPAAKKSAAKRTTKAAAGAKPAAGRAAATKAPAKKAAKPAKKVKARGK